ncbi:MAG: hypothetical protein Q9165_007337 [Trypethelium subeluteriae]
MKHRAWSLGPTVGQSRHSLFSKYSTTKSSSEATNPRWLPALRARIGRCIQFGLRTQQVQQAGKILEELNHDWREFIAGSQGFLTDRNHRGLYRQEVVWGEMPMKWPDRVSVYHKLRELPSESTDSFILDVIIVSELHRRVAARCVEDIVVYDYRNAKKVPLRPFMVKSFQDTFRLQEQAKHEYSAKMARLMDQVRELEKDSWDRPDAKEDVGNSGQAV